MEQIFPFPLCKLCQERINSSLSADAIARVRFRAFFRAFLGFCGAPLS
jgi:hypothetical protein